jgi:hypothetical protein
MQSKAAVQNVDETVEDFCEPFVEMRETRVITGDSEEFKTGYE